ncbi:la-related protein 6C [Cajanus cajan]|uniref:La-related protein 7 n=1 Tax=Cajanus cajan TaxID=3821 RepID=A0A151S504_CAJCA|nr:la-related protein 6C [Cajanus cajan]KYP49838.1 La-related protein 7 [Cajanus cajan]
MAQAQPEEKIHENPEKDTTAHETGNSSFKFNAQAPEFVPRSHTQMPISGYFYPCFQILGGSGESDWFFVGDQDPACLIPSTNVALPNCSKNILTPDLQQKIVKQVEYQFSDMSLLANESFQKQMNKDPEGFVPITVIASTKKVKSLVSNIHLLTQAIRSSSKLVLSADSKKVKRKHPFTEKEKEDLQSRTVVAENLPDDHSHQNLQKIFSTVGSVKTIRICHPQESNSSRPKSDFFVSNKLHALIEYETSDIADKAVEKLNDERNWRKGMRVRLLLRCSPKSVLKCRKSEFDGYLEEEEILNSETAEDSSHSNNADLFDSNVDENSIGSKKGWARGRGKGRGRTQGRGLLAPPSQSSSTVLCDVHTKPNTKGPRMPDGTRGFTMGRGKPMSPSALVTSPQPQE